MNTNSGSVQNFPKNTSEKETEKTYFHMLMTVKLWGVDRLYILIIILNPYNFLFQLFVQNVVYLFYS